MNLLPLFRRPVVGLFALALQASARAAAPAPFLPALDTPAPYQRGPFVHPGGLHTGADLERMKARVAAKHTPWIECWGQLLRDPLASADYRPAPRANLGDSRQRASQDAHAAYLNFMRGYISGDQRHIDAAIRICNDWSAAVNQVPSGTDIPGLSGIPIAEFAIVGELLRVSPHWKSEDLARFQRMTTDYLYPVCHTFLTTHNGAHVTNHWANWDIANIGALVAIGVLCDRPDIYDEGVAYYLRGEGMGSIMNAVYKIHSGGLGQWQESGRDQSHAQLGVGMLAQACQIAWNQGLDLYGVADNRLLAGAEYVARSNLGHAVPFAFYTNSHPANNFWLSNNALYRIEGWPLWELVYNHYVVLRGRAAPGTSAMVQLIRPETGGKDHFGYGTLTFTLDAAASPYPPLPIPAAPTALKADAGVGLVELNWTAPPGDVAQGYEVRRATSSDGPFAPIFRSTGHVGTSLVDTEVQNGTRYFYEVAAVNQSGVSPASARVEAQPVAAEALPSSWSQADIGRTGRKGSASFSRVQGNTVIVTGAGQEIGGKADSFGFATREISGDFTLRARLSDVKWSGGRNRVGLVLRETLEPGAKTAFVTLGDIGARQTRFGLRRENGGDTRHRNGNDYTWTPVWFRLQREGELVIASHSGDGKTWFEIGREKLPMSRTGYVGLAACSKDEKAETTARFDHVTIGR
jgi:hypothetical protein